MDSRKPSLEKQIVALLDIDQTAARLNVHAATVRRWVRSKRVPAIRIGTRVLRFDPRAIEKFITANSSSVENQ